VEKPSAYQGDETYVFVCYAHEDSDTVYPEIAWLQAEGVNVWYDEGISLGTEWTQALADAIQGCAKFLFLVTPNSVNRENCRRELNFAQEEGRDVLAVHLQPTDVPSGLRLSLNNRQAIFRHQLPDKQYRNEILQALLSTAAKSAMVAIPPRSPIRALRLAAFAVATVLIVVAGAWWFDDGDKESAELVEAGTQAELIDLPRSTLLQNSIAVLPFENLSPDPDNAYFAAGIHEEIINQLVKIRDLSVIARTSVMQYAGVHKPIVEIANDLNVSTVMAGRVRYAGNRVRITAQLIDGESGTNLWSEAYEEDLENVFGIQLDIATQIAGTLEAELSPTERERIARRATDSPEAYTHYLRALNSWGTFAPTSAIHRELEAAVELDPDFAAALAFDSTVYALERHPRSPSTLCFGRRGLVLLALGVSVSWARARLRT
jgi:TolB-like protein